MATFRRILLSVIALGCVATGCWVYIDSFGGALKGTESNSMGLAFGAITQLEAEGAVMPTEVDRFTLAVAIQPPIKSAIHDYMTRDDGTGLIMIVLGFLVLAVAWLPGGRAAEGGSVE
jgi:hypothetical protein